MYVVTSIVFIVHPNVFQVGDYILTPAMCVERKSLSDLVSSLLNGRLYTQAQQMLNHYESAIILIEDSEQRLRQHPKKRMGITGGAFCGEMSKRYDVD
jgi:ERCC4-type nuclease